MNYMTFNAKEQKDKVVQWIRDWFEENGKGCVAVVGISGGKDSTVTAALCVEALSRFAVYGVLMPNGEQKDIDDAISVCEHLGISFGIFDISHAVRAVTRTVNWEQSLSETAQINLPPRIRMATLYAISQSKNGRVANTCNLSEDYVGYSTKYGDAAGDFAPLKSFTSDEVVEIGRVLGLPEHLLTKPPADGLCGKTDEENLGFSYAVLNKYIRTGEIDDEEVKKKIDTLHKKNKFKEELIAKYRYIR